eukprot:g569.t1
MTEDTEADVENAKLLGPKSAPDERAGGESSTRTHRYNLYVHSIAFMILFSAFQTASEYAQPVLLELGYDNLGFESTAVVYLVLSVSNLVSPVVVDRFGAVHSMIGGSVLYLAYLGSFLAPHRPLVLFSSALLGFGAAVLWTAQGVFLTANTTSARRGRDSGIFWALLQMRLIIGNAFAYHALADVKVGEIQVSSARTFFFEMMCLGSIGVAIFFFLKDTGGDAGVSDGCGHLSASLRKMQSLVATSPMRLLCLISIYSGLVLTFWSGKFFSIVSGHNESDQDTSLPASFRPAAVAVAGTVVAIGEIVGGIMLGRLADSRGRGSVVALMGVSHFLAFALVHAVVYREQSGTINDDEDSSDWTTSTPMHMMLVAALLLGFGDAAVSTLMYGLVGERYPGKNESAPAFAVVKLAQSIAAAIAFLYAAEFPLYVQLLILLVSMVLSIACVQRLGSSVAISALAVPSSSSKRSKCPYPMVHPPLNVEKFRKMWTEVRINVYEPFSWILKALILSTLGMSSRAVRIVTLLFHCTNTVLLRHVSERLLTGIGRFPRRVAALSSFVCALLWGLHPLHAEVVGWPSAQPYALAGFFALLSVRTYVFCDVDSNGLWGSTLWANMLSSSLYVAAVLSKSVAVFLPVTFVALDFVCLVCNISRHRVIKVAETDKAAETDNTDKVKYSFFYAARHVMHRWTLERPHCWIAVAFVVVTLHANERGAQLDSDTYTLTPPERAMRVFLTFTQMAQHMLWPVGLSPHYRLHLHELWIGSAAATMSCCCWTLVAVYLMPRWREYSPLLASVFVASCALAPVSGIVNHGMVVLGADRYGYFPTMSLAVCIAGHLARALIRVQRSEDTRVPPSSTTDSSNDRRRSTRKYFQIGICSFVAILAYATITFGQFELWRNQRTMLDGALTIDSADWRMMDFAIETLLEDGRDDDAHRLMDICIHHSPKKGIKAQMNIAKFHVIRNEVSKACARYEVATTSSVETTAALHNNLGVCALYASDFERAEWHFVRGIAMVSSLKPEQAEILEDNLRVFGEWDKKSKYRELKIVEDEVGPALYELSEDHVCKSVLNDIISEEACVQTLAHTLKTDQKILSRYVARYDREKGRSSDAFEDIVRSVGHKELRKIAQSNAESVA